MTALYSKTIVLISLLIIPLAQISAQKSVHWDVTALFNVRVDDAKPGTDRALDSALQYFAVHPQDTIVLNYPAGTYNFLGEEPSIDFGEPYIPGTKGRLEITGGGYENTVFISKDPRADAIYGREVFRILFKGIHFTRDYCTVTQGTVVSVSQGNVVMDLHTGFPTPDSLIQFGRRNESGLYLKKYTDDPDDPHIIPEDEDNEQVAWDTANTYQINGRRWNFGTRNPSTLPTYKEGDILGVKLKHGGQTYWFSGGDNIVFEDCKWTRKTRGVLRGGISNIRFSGCMIDRGPKIGGRTPCLASPGGGPQCGQPNDPRVSNVIIEDCRIESTGDDNCALFNVDGGIVRDCYFSDGFAESTRLTQCTKICLDNNTTIRCSPSWVVGSGGDTASDCSNLDPYPPTKPENLRAIDLTHNSASLAWSPSFDDFGISHYDLYQGSKKIGTTIDTLYTVTGLSPSVFYIFRVRAVDSTGNLSAYSDNLEITTPDNPVTLLYPGSGHNAEIAWSMYPNPSNGYIFVETDHNLLNARIRIHNLHGKEMIDIPVNQSITKLDISNILPGLCYIELKSRSSKSVKKIIIL